jgi:hypothetical protein
MTVCFDERIDLASYALGLLDDHDATRVENHLAECDGCAEELEALLPTVGVMSTVDLDMLQLSGVDRSSLLVASGPLDESATMRGPGIHAPATGDAGEDDDIVSILGGRHQRREHAARRERTSRYAGHGEVVARGGAAAWARRRPLALLVAAAVVVIMAGLVFTFTPFGAHKAGQVAGGTGNSPAANPPASTDGTYLWQANKQTGTRLDLTMAGRPWGTHFSFSITEDQGPLRCRLVTVDSHGATETVSSWQVPAEGYGTPAHPGRLELQANSSLSPSDIAKVQVQEIDAAGKARTLIDLTTK